MTAERSLAEVETEVVALLNDRCRSWHGWRWRRLDGQIQVWQCTDVGAIGALIRAGFAEVVMHAHRESAYEICACQPFRSVP